MTSKALTRLAVVSALAAASGCVDSLGLGTPDNSVGVIVSAPVHSAPAASPATGGAGAVYVSLPPGQVAAAMQATIRSQATGEAIATVVVDGGFDPVPIAASVGDTLAVDITSAAATALTHARLAVSAVRPLKVVRTSPPAGGRDVPLNATIVIVFSEPIDSAALSDGSIQLLLGTTPVAGTLRFSDASRLRVEFQPATLLAAQTTYRLVVTDAVRDVNGATLDAAFEIAFTTGTTTIAPPAVSLVVTGLPTTVAAGVSAFAITAQDASGHTATGYTGTVHFSSTDGIALLPQDYTFMAGDAGVRSFAVTLKTAGDQTITATDLTTSITSSGAVAVTVAAAGGEALYVVNDGHGGSVDGTSPLPPWSITAYTGNATPTATVAGANTGFMDPQGIALDAAGRVYVADGMGRNRILVFAPGAAGNAAPVDSIAGSNTGLSYPQGVALDATGRLYVANIRPSPADSYSVTVYAPGASGNAAPIATIQGSNTGLNVPIGIALDATGRLYVANATSVTVYAAGASGNAAPLATIQGSNTGLDHWRPAGIAVDASGQVYVATTSLCFNPDTATHGESVLVFAPGAAGNAIPIATIQGSNTGLDGSTGIAVDAAGWLYVANATECPAVFGWPRSGSITVYAPGAMGNVAPFARIVAKGTSGLFGPAWVALR